MELTTTNYYSREADEQFMSYSQYKNFLQCEAAALASLKGEYVQPRSDALLVGSYVHAWSENKLDEFTEQHPEMFSSKGPTKGELKSTFQHANTMIETLAGDPFCMFVLEGRKEVPLAVEMFGAPWKGKVDVLNAERGYLADLKTARNLADTEWIFSESENKNIKVSWIEKYNYLMQAAIYTEMERIASGSEQRKDFLIVAVDKQDPPDHMVISLKDDTRIEDELAKIQDRLPRILQVKSGMAEPVRCGTCAYCRSTKKVNKAVHYTELNP